MEEYRRQSSGGRKSSLVYIVGYDSQSIHLNVNHLTVKKAENIDYLFRQSL